MSNEVEAYQVDPVVLVPDAAVEQRLERRPLHRPLAAPQSREERLAALALQHVRVRLGERAQRAHRRQPRRRRRALRRRRGVLDLQDPDGQKLTFKHCATQWTQRDPKCRNYG